MLKQAMTATALLLAATGVAAAAPGDISGSPDGAQLELIAQPTHPCNVKGGFCLAAGAHTVAVASAEVASLPVNGKAAPPVVPQFARADSAEGSSAGAWAIELDGTLKRPAWNGNALFLFYDLEDPSAVDNHEYTAMYQTPLKAGKTLAARATLAPDEGFRAGHTYRVRIVQLINNKEVLLAEGDFALQ